MPSVGTSEGTLRPAQRDAPRPGETAVNGQRGTHAETNILNHAKANGQWLTGVAGYTYMCDADGNRVEKSSGSTGTIYWYMTPGIVAESDGRRACSLGEWQLEVPWR